MLGTTASRNLSASEIKSISHLLLKLCHFVCMLINLLQRLQNINKHAVYRERVCEGEFLSYKHALASPTLKNTGSVFSLQLEIRFICNFAFYSLFSDFNNGRFISRSRWSHPRRWVSVDYLQLWCFFSSFDRFLILKAGVPHLISKIEMASQMLLWCQQCCLINDDVHVLIWPSSLRLKHCRRKTAKRTKLVVIWSTLGTIVAV